MTIGMVVALVKAFAPGADPAVIEQAVADWLDAHPEATTTVEDGSITEAKLAQDVLAELGEIDGLKEAIAYKTPEQFGAKGDGVTDDSEAVQDAVDAGYAVRFADNKTYYLASTVTIDHDCHLVGGKNTVIKTKTPSGGTVNNAFVATGTLKKTTTLTTDYSSVGSTANSGNKFTLSDMEDIEIGDLMVIKATDQYYSYAREYYYLGATLLIKDIYDDHLFTCDNMPFDIENTENVSVYIYSSPRVVFEGLNFVSDLDSLPSYRYFILMKWCSNSAIKNCKMTEMPCGIEVNNCVNTLIDCVEVSKSKYDNNINGDGYGIFITSSTNTIIQRVIALCSQGCVELGGNIPNINTYVYNCKIASECRSTGLDLHENSYNIVVEDCVIAGAALQGTAMVNRCRFIYNNRTGTQVGIAYYGTHDRNRSKIRITNCEFDDDLQIQILAPGTQNPIQSFKNIIGSFEISDTDNFLMYFTPTVTASVTENIVEHLVIKRCKRIKQIIHNANITGNAIQYMEVIDSTFRTQNWIRTTGSSVDTDGVRYLSVQKDNPRTDRILVDIKENGGKYSLPENVPIAFTSATTGHYVVCGDNFASDDVDDYQMGSVTATEGQTLTRTENSNFNNCLTVDSSGNLVFTQPSNYDGKPNVYAKCMAYTDEDCMVRTSCVLKNTGETNGATWRLYIVVVNCETGKVVYGGRGTSGTASAEGVTITHNWSAGKNSLVLCFLTCTEVVVGSKTTFEQFVAKTIPFEFDSGSVTYEKYNGDSLDGNGTLYSVNGVNYVMATPENFEAKFKIDLLNNPVGLLPSGTGVSF